MRHHTPTMTTAPTRCPDLLPMPIPLADSRPDAPHRHSRFRFKSIFKRGELPGYPSCASTTPEYLAIEASTIEIDADERESAVSFYTTLF